MTIDSDKLIVERQIGREPRGMVRVAAYDTCGEILVVQTAPWVAKSRNNKSVDSEAPVLEPFPTMYYLTSPKVVKLVSQLEASGIMKQLQERITPNSSSYDEGLCKKYLEAHLNYIQTREDLAKELKMSSLLKTHGDFSAGGMPSRVKCLHALVAHELATGKNPIGKIALEMLNISSVESSDIGKPANKCWFWDVSDASQISEDK